MQVDERVRQELRRLATEVEADPEVALLGVLRAGRRRRAARRTFGVLTIGSLAALGVLLAPRLVELLPGASVAPGGGPGSNPVVSSPRVIARGTTTGYQWTLVAFRAGQRLCMKFVPETERAGRFGPVTIRSGYGSTGCELADTEDGIRFFVLEVETPQGSQGPVAFGWVRGEVSRLTLEMTGVESRHVPLLNLPRGLSHPANPFVIAPLPRGSEYLVARDNNGTELGRDQIPGEASGLGCPVYVADLPTYSC
jgi:hypothetical protein